MIRQTIHVRRLAPGILYALGIALIADVAGRFVPLVGGPVIAILLGITVASFAGRPAWAAGGLRFSGKTLLQLAVVFVGASLGIGQIIGSGASSFWVMIGSLATAFVVSALLGRAFGVSGHLTLLIGAGTGICGGSAIAAVSSVIRADDQDIAYSMSTIFLFNVVAVVLFPLVGHLFGFSAHRFGTWAGTAINDTSSVVAAGYAYSSVAGAQATIVKLTRTTMIIPTVLTLSIVELLRIRRSRKSLPPAMRSPSSAAPADPSEGPREISRAVSPGAAMFRAFPWFVLGFVAMSALNSTHILSPAVSHGFADVGRFLIIVALAAIGLGTDLRRMASAGLLPLLLGLGVWVSVAISSLVIQSVVGG